MPAGISRREGMGIDSMKSRARAIGGQLDMESRANRGTRLVCSLRLASPSANVRESDEHRPQPRSGRRGAAKVVIIDDHPSSERASARSSIPKGPFGLRRGCHRDGCDRGRRSTSPDIAIVDPPGSIQWLDLIRDLEVRWRGLPVLVLSNHDESPTRNAASAPGAVTS
jgi:hypothetical protein